MASIMKMSLPKGPISKLEHIDVLEHHAKLFVWMHQRACSVRCRTVTVTEMPSRCFYYVARQITVFWYWAVAVTVVVQLLSYAAW